MLWFPAKSVIKDAHPELDEDFSTLVFKIKLKKGVSSIKLITVPFALIDFFTLLHHFQDLNHLVTQLTL